MGHALSPKPLLGEYVPSLRHQRRNAEAVEIILLGLLYMATVAESEQR